MKLTSSQQRLFDFVKEQHGDQKRKYTGAPYWTHLWDVAEIISHYPEVEMGIEIALCHDLIEDTPCTAGMLDEALLRFKYFEWRSRMVIVRDVSHLTDEYTKEAYPEFNREKRKALEAKRLKHITANAQSVKYADMMDNTQSIVQNDLDFSKVYLAEIGKKIYSMDKGIPDLHKRCVATYEQAVLVLKMSDKLISAFKK